MIWRAVRVWWRVGGGEEGLGVVGEGLGVGKFFTGH